MVLEASFGLGESVVSGEVTPDRFLVARDNFGEVQTFLGNKSRRVAALGAGPMPAANETSLTAAQIAALGAIGLRIEQLFGKPMDIEWGLAGEELAVLQCRPIRGLEVAQDVEVGRVAEIERLKSLSAGRRRIWVAHNLGETLRAPTPLTWDIIGHFMSGAGGFGGLYQDLGFRPSPRVCREGFLELIAGRIYADPERLAQFFWGDGPFQYDLDAVLHDSSLLDQAPTRLDPNRVGGQFLLRLPGLMYAMFRAGRISQRLRHSVQVFFEKDALPPYLDYVQQKRGENLSKLDTVQVCAELRSRCTRVLDEFGKESLKPGYFGALAFVDLRRLLRQVLGPEKGGQLACTLTSGLEGDTTVAQNQLLFQAARGEATLEEFLKVYGHRAAGEMELAEPRFRENPGQLERSLSALRRCGRSPQEIHGEHAAQRSETEKDLPRLLFGCGGQSFQKKIGIHLRQAQALLAYREAGKHYLMMGYELLRQAILELARRWQLGRDIFFLRREELERFEERREDLLETAAQRRLRWQSFQRLDMPAAIDSRDLDRLGLPQQYENAGELKGEAVAAGVATGTARVVFDPGEERDLGSEFILVCPSTDPGWTALFVNARGLIVERGGVLSHGAIVARDFGIPAVVCPGATKTIQDGSKLHLDGNRGVVQVLHPG
jgi:pyruvate,water dikinase